MAPKTLLLAEKEGVATVTVNRPEKLNALNSEVIAELTESFEALKGRRDIGAVILTGAGEKAFIAGADIAELAGLDRAGATENSKRGWRLTRRIETLGKPVIAAINGFALGGGAEMAMACHVRIAVEGAKLGQPEVKLGLICGYGGTQRLPRLVGRGRATELLLAGEPIDAQEAWRIGLVNRVVARDKLLPECEALARKFLSVGPVAVRHTLDAVDRGLDLTLDEAMDLEADLFGRCFETKDMREGTKAFLERRPAKFVGE